MEDSSNKEITVVNKIEDILIPGWTKDESSLLLKGEEEGTRPIAPSLSSQLLNLFLEGYSCAEIAKNNKPFSEMDILVCRKKYKWDDEKDKYAFDLAKQVREKLIKQKLESLEFLTNVLSVTHKKHKDQMIKYLQTGKEEDMPENWASSPTTYKSILETIQKITGEDRVSTQKITSEATVKVEGNVTSTAALHPELQAKLLRRLSESTVKKVTEGNE